MYGVRAARAKRFSLLLLDEEEEYVQDWVVLAAWPVERVAGNWQRSPLLPGRVRLGTRSLFFEPDDVRVPIVRIPLSAVQSLSSGPSVASVAGTAAAAAATARGPTGGHATHHHHHASSSSSSASSSSSPSGPSLLVDTREVVLMRANMEEVPYTFLRWGEGAGAAGPGLCRWAFGPCYSPLQPLLAQAAALWEINKRPREERNAALEDLSRQRLDSVSFDLSRLVDFGERVVWCGPVVGLTPLVREQGHLAITPARVYFQPLHNIAGTTPVKSHPLAAIAAVARRRSSLRHVGLELFFLHPAATAPSAVSWSSSASSLPGAASAPSAASAASDLHARQAHAQLAAAVAGGPTWDAPSAFFAFRSQTDREAARHLLTQQPDLGRCVPRRPSPGPAPSPTPGGLGPHPHWRPTGAGAGPGAGTGPAGGGGGGGGGWEDGGPGAVGGADPLAAHGMLLEAAGPWLRRVTAAWQRGALSNFDYLLYLNFAAGRSFNDLAQWPVFPWVLQNYVSASLDLNDPNYFRDLSKPVGALSPARLEEFRRRYRDMPHDAFEGSVPPFLYGTHYSTPGYVMYWLVRAAPSHMLRLQNGRFDAPDRLFASVQEAWEGVLHSTTDVKELIPEFFMPSWDFLVNGRRLPLGVRQSGRPVGDVELPPWATDPRDFLAKNRAALEAPAVSGQLHGWIDLIFGYKQRGEAAEAADNVFYHLTYEGAVDVGAVTSLVELKALETQINEFGQTPKQLFTTPHPPRLVCPPAPDPATIFPEERAEATPASTAAAPIGPAGPTCPAGGGGSGGTGYGGDGDAGNRDLALALLSTIMATAAAPEGAPSSPAAASCEALAPEVPPPVVMGDLDAAASGSQSAVATPPPTPSTPPGGGGPGGAPAGAGGSAASLLSSFLKLGRYQQQQASAAADGLASFASSRPAVSTGPGATAGPSAASSLHAAASTAAGSLLSSWPFGGRLAGSHGRRPGEPNGAASGAADGAATNPAGPLSGSRSDPALSPSGPDPATAAGNRPPCERVSSDGAVVAALAEAALEGTNAAVVASGGAAVDTRGSAAAASTSGPPADWGWGSRCVQPFRTSAWTQLTRGSLAAVASGHNGYLYCAGQSGIRVVAEGPVAAAAAGANTNPTAAAAAASGGGLLHVVRSAQLEGELLSLALLPLGGGGGTRAADGGGGGLPKHHRLMLVGSHNRRVYCYAPDAGRLVGSFEAHDDAVCCLELVGAGLGAGAPALVTSSWDCSVKIWSLAEGRAPWSTGLSLATAELRDFDSGVWALATDPWSGPLLATGTEEGVVALWDTRAPSAGPGGAAGGQGGGRGRGPCCVWLAHVADDYVGGLAIISGPQLPSSPSPLSHHHRHNGEGGGSRGCAPAMLLAATADGALTLYDIRGGTGGGAAAASPAGSSGSGRGVLLVPEPYTAKEANRTYGSDFLSAHLNDIVSYHVASGAVLFPDDDASFSQRLTPLGPKTADDLLVQVVTDTYGSNSVQVTGGTTGAVWIPPLAVGGLIPRIYLYSTYTVLMPSSLGLALPPSPPPKAKSLTSSPPPPPPPPPTGASASIRSDVPPEPLGPAALPPSPPPKSMTSSPPPPPPPPPTGASASIRSNVLLQIAVSLSVLVVFILA